MVSVGVEQDEMVDGAGFSVGVSNEWIADGAVVISGSVVDLLTDKVYVGVSPGMDGDWLHGGVGVVDAVSKSRFVGCGDD